MRNTELKYEHSPAQACRDRRTMRLTFLSLCITFVSIMCSDSSKAGIYDDRRWSTRFGLPGIQAADTSISRDSLPIAAVLIDGSTYYIGGRFVVPTDNVVAYDVPSQQWREMGRGLDSSVRALAMFNGDVVAAGMFIRSGANSCQHIARFDKNDQKWHAMGGGTNGDVTLLCVYRGELYASGDFSVAGNRACRNIARWDGQEWKSLGNGIANGLNGEISALCVYQDKLFVAGTFKDVAGDLTATSFVCWDGQRWQNAESLLGFRLGHRKANLIYDLATSDSLLALVGAFDSVIVNNKQVYAPNLLLYNGTDWSAPIDQLENKNAALRACALSSKDLYVIGDSLTQINNTIVFGIGRWDRSTSRWYGLASGVSDHERSPWMRCIALSTDTTIVAGRFRQAGGHFSLNIAGFSNISNDWFRLHANSSMGFDNSCVCSVLDGELIAAGLFTHSGEIPVANIARWRDQQWQQIGSGIPGAFLGRTNQRTTPPWKSPAIYSVAKYNDEFLIGGDFTGCGSVQANSLIAFDGSTVHALGGSATGSSAWDRANVSAFLKRGTQLYVGGAFISMGNTVCNSIALWDGSSWSALNNGIDSSNFYNPVTALAEGSNQTILVGGSYYSIGSNACNGLSQWSNAQWDCFPFAAGDGFNGINALVTRGDEVFAAGYMSRRGNKPVNGIAYWDGHEWFDLAGGLTGGEVYAMALQGDELYIGGRFSGVGDVVANNAAVWNLKQKRWYALGSGLNNVVTGICVLNDTVFFSGDFSKAGTSVSSFIAAWIPESSVGIEAAEYADQKQIHISPNPAREHIQILANVGLSGYCRISIVDVFGREVQRSEQQLSHAQQQLQSRLAIDQLCNGTYYCIIQSHDKVISEAFMIQR